jgi:hypothetical protein
MTPIAGLVALGAALGLGALGQTRKLFTGDPDDLPGVQLDRLLFKHDNLISDLSVPLRKGDCKTFTKRYLRTVIDLHVANNLIKESGPLSPVDEDGAPFHRDGTQQLQVMSAYATILEEAEPAFKTCEEILRIKRGMN